MSFIQQIKQRAELGKPPVKGGRSNKFGKISFDELIFLPAQLSKFPVDYFREKISAKTIIGKTSKRPLELELPILNAAISYGAVSKRAKIALAEGAALAGTAANTGEGGMLEEEREVAKILIVQYSTGRFGITEEILKKAEAVEIKIGQGAKPGQGGLLPEEKLSEEIAQVRGVELGKTVHSPATHPDIKSLEDLKKKVEWLKELTGGKPIIIKLGAGEVGKDVKLAIEAGADIVAVDGMEGGTGAAPEVMLNEVGLPTIPAIIQARKVLDEMRSPQELIVGGGINTGGDMAKCLALGADGVFLGFPLLIAMGCSWCQKCSEGNCPFGIATQKPELESKLNIEEAAKKIANYLKACSEEIKMITAACGKTDIHNLDRGDLRSLSILIKETTGIELV